MNKTPTPCLICGKDVYYLWEDSSNIDNGADVKIQAWYGSRHDMEEFSAVVCDDCLDTAIKNKRIELKKVHGPFG